MPTAVIIGRSGNIGGAVSEYLSHNDFQVVEIVADVTKVTKFGVLPSSIDIAIYLPGKNCVKPLSELHISEWDDIISVNLRGAFLFAQAAIPGLKKANGCFVSVSSILSQHPYPNRVAYAVAKAGLETFTKGLAVEGVLSHCIRLGHLDSYTDKWPKDPKVLDAVKERTPSKRLVTKDDVASYILWLARGGCKAVSGSVIDFDAGYCINRWPL